MIVAPFTRAVATLPAAALASVPALASPDAELIVLGEQLRANWAVLRAALARDCSDEEFDELSNDGAEIISKIETIAATTIAGLKVKALAVAWCAGSETFADEDGGEDPFPFDRVNASLFRDLLTGAAS